MDVSGWSVGWGIGAIAVTAAAWAWARQRRLVAELARRLEESEHSRMDLEQQAHQVDDRLASMAEVLARQQAAMKTAQVSLHPMAARAVAPVQALLQHLGDMAPVAIEGPASDWIDTEPSTGPDDTFDEGAHPAFAETMPAEFACPPDR